MVLSVLYIISLSPSSPWLTLSLFASRFYLYLFCMSSPSLPPLPGSLSHCLRHGSICICFVCPLPLSLLSLAHSLTVCFTVLSVSVLYVLSLSPSSPWLTLSLFASWFYLYLFCMSSPSLPPLPGSLSHCLLHGSICICFVYHLPLSLLSLAHSLTVCFTVLSVSVLYIISLSPSSPWLTLSLFASRFYLYLFCISSPSLPPLPGSLSHCLLHGSICICFVYHLPLSLLSLAHSLTVCFTVLSVSVLYIISLSPSSPWLTLSLFASRFYLYLFCMSSPSLPPLPASLPHCLRHGSICICFA